MIARRPLRAALALLVLAALGVPSARAFPTAAQVKTAFTAIDTSRSDAISLEEWNTASFALFRAADQNNNNFIDAAELAGSSIAEDTFIRADTDHDGRLSVTEFMALRRSLFRIADIDRNDFLTSEEYEVLLLLELVGWNDRNQNGRIDHSELAESLTAAFGRLDADHDGFLSHEEGAYLQPAAFAQFDTDRDGKLSLSEYLAGYRRLIFGT